LRRRSVVLTGTAAADVSDATEASGFAGDVAGFIVLLPIFLDNLPRTFGLEIPVNTVSNLQSMVFGGLIIFFLIVEPRGLARLWQIGKEKLRIWPFPY